MAFPTGWRLHGGLTDDGWRRPHHEGAEYKGCVAASVGLVQDISASTVVFSS